MDAPFDWQRGSRSSFSLGTDHGVYALFLRASSRLPGVNPGANGLIYIGLAANRNGLKGRCHFDAQTRNHSPRKSLAVLLMKELSLIPVLLRKPNSPDTWGLERLSDNRLSAWMHANLDLAVEVHSDPSTRETELVGFHRPLLNLKKCVQSEQHRRISEARHKVLAGLKGQPVADVSATPKLYSSTGKSDSPLSEEAKSIPQTPGSACRFTGSDIDTAETIAARYNLNPKSYRQRLRDSISWYRKPQDWSFAVNSAEWRDMIAIADKMAR